MVASLECSKRLKAKYPDIRMVFVSDPKTFLGLPLGLRHVVIMQGGSLGMVKEYDGKRFVQLGVMQGRTLADEAIRETRSAHPASPPVTAGPALANKNNSPVTKDRDNVFPQPEYPFMRFFLPPPPPPPPPGVGGVDINPEPREDPSPAVFKLRRYCCRVAVAWGSISKSATKILQRRQVAWCASCAKGCSLSDHRRRRFSGILFRRGKQRLPMPRVDPAEIAPCVPP